MHRKMQERYFFFFSDFGNVVSRINYKQLQEPEKLLEVWNNTMMAKVKARLFHSFSDRWVCWLALFLGTLNFNAPRLINYTLLTLTCSLSCNSFVIENSILYLTFEITIFFNCEISKKSFFFVLFFLNIWLLCMCLLYESSF